MGIKDLCWCGCGRQGWCSLGAPPAALGWLSRPSSWRPTTFLEVSAAAIRPGHPFLPVFLSLLPAPLQHKPPICSFSHCSHFCCTSLSLERHCTGTGMVSVLAALKTQNPAWQLWMQASIDSQLKIFIQQKYIFMV